MGQTRGRRREKKERKEAAQAAEPARVSHDEDFIPLDDGSDGEAAIGPVSENTPGDYTGKSHRDNRSSFFGLLDRSELEYFKHAESTLVTNALGADERPAFVASVFAEARGRELKLATNQVCSKLLERLVQIGDEEQIEQLVQAVEPYCVDLAFQKFSSHCIEAIITRAVHIPACKDRLVSIAQRMAQYLGDFVSDRYGCHVLQTVILAYAGIPEEMRSKRSKLARKHTEIETEETESHQARDSPAALKKEARDIVTALIDTTDRPHARKLAIDPVSSALMQVLLVAEAALKSGYKLLGIILDEPDAQGFVSHCLSDPVGAHFLETAIRVMPAKRVSQFAETLPIVKLATSEIESASYIVQALLARSHLSTARKREIVQKQLLPNLAVILDHNAAIIVTALSIDRDAVARATVAAFNDHGLNLRDVRKAALFEQLAEYAPFIDRATDFVVGLSVDEVRDMALDPTQSYVLQHLLTPSANIVSRRKLVNKLIPLIPQLSVNAYGSHIIDALWPACYKLKFNRERTANELVKNAEQVKHSPYGRKVWLNWRMEKYVHKRHEWWQAVKAVEDELRAKLEPETASTTPSTRVAQAAQAAKPPQDRVKRRKTTA